MQVTWNSHLNCFCLAWAIIKTAAKSYKNSGERTIFWIEPLLEAPAWFSLCIKTYLLIDLCHEMKYILLQSYILKFPLPNFTYTALLYRLFQYRQHAFLYAENIKGHMIGRRKVRALSTPKRQILFCSHMKVTVCRPAEIVIVFQAFTLI